MTASGQTRVPVVTTPTRHRHDFDSWYVCRVCKLPAIVCYALEVGSLPSVLLLNGDGDEV
jgi:hypothetical protein